MNSIGTFKYRGEWKEKWNECVFRDVRSMHWTFCYIFFPGRPHAAKIVSPRLSSFKDQYNLTWSVNSFLPIEEYRILYRVNSVSSYVYLNSHKVGKNMKRKRGSGNCNQPNTFWKNTVVEIVPYQWGMKFLKVKDIISKLLLFLTLSLFTCALFTSTTFKRCIRLKYNLLLKANK